MELIKTMHDKKIWLENYEEGQTLSLPFDGRPFAAVIWNNREGYVSDALINTLLKAGCKYFLAGGYESQEWEGIADALHVSLYPDFHPPESEHVMTTSHPDEALSEVLWFAFNNTNFDHHHFKDFIIVQVGSRYSKEEIAGFISESDRIN